MNDVSPDMVMGKSVVTSGGDIVGEVVDVGVHDRRRVKFLLVQEEARPTPVYRRLNIEDVTSVGQASVVVRGRR